MTNVAKNDWPGWARLPVADEIEAYLNFVADRLELRRDLSFHTKVVGMTFDEDAGRPRSTTTPSCRWCWPPNTPPRSGIRYRQSRRICRPALIWTVR